MCIRRESGKNPGDPLQRKGSALRKCGKTAGKTRRMREKREKREIQKIPRFPFFPLFSREFPASRNSRSLPAQAFTENFSRFLFLVERGRGRVMVGDWFL
jgi:hypothetical protein